MKIKQIKINAYGKIKNKQLELQDNINIIHGKNESGKSTILRYIINSFYGISKNKKGKEYSDYEKYEPWQGEDFSGKLTYELDNKNQYEIYRDFKKKNPKIFNNKMEDISNTYVIDKTLGNQFFTEQTNIDEKLFLSTLITSQQEVKIPQQEQGILIQKIANLVGTGDDNTSYKLAIDRINRRQLEEIGTTRSKEKPINLINKKIEELEKEKEEIKKYETSKYEIEEIINQNKKEINDLEKELDTYNKLKQILENENIQKQEIYIQEDIKKKNTEKIKQIDNQLDDIKMQSKTIEEKNYNKKENNTKFTILSTIIILIINILQFIFIKKSPINYSILAISIIALLLIIIKYINTQKQNKKIQIKYQEEQKNLEIIKEKIKLLENEVNIIEKNNEEITQIIKQKQQDIFNQKKNQYEKIYQENPILQIDIENTTLQETSNKIQELQTKINDKKIQLHSTEIDKNLIESKLDKIAQIEEEYQTNIKRKKELINLNTSMEIAKQILTSSYEIMKNTVTPKFTQNLSNNIAQITNNKYTNVRFNEETGLMVENEYGEYIPATKLSIGTIDQLYLSLRLSMIDELSNEKMPIILDEAFAYFDDERLENFLKYLNTKYSDRQIIIFTCTNREEEILKKNDIPISIQYI